MGKLTDEQIRKAVPFASEAMSKGASWRDIFNAVAPHLQYQPEPVSGDLVEKCCKVYDQWAHPSHTGMSAVIRVVLDEALQAPTNDERRAYERSRPTLTGYYMLADVVALLHDRKSGLLRPKSPEERVRIKSSPPSNNHVELDGKSVFSCRRLEDAEIYRLGLIAKLKEEESK